MRHAAEPRVGKYVKYDAGEFVIITSRSAGQARKFVEDLARFRLTLERVLGKRSTKSPFPTTIVITSASDWETWLQPRENVAGFFQRARFANYLAMNGDAPPAEGSPSCSTNTPTTSSRHSSRANTRRGSTKDWPSSWVTPGSTRTKSSSQIPMGRLYEARDGAWIPFDRLMRVDRVRSRISVAPAGGHRSTRQSWLTVHYGMVENRDFGRQIIQYLNELNTAGAAGGSGKDQLR